MSAEWKRRCPKCEHQNPPTSSECEKDGEDISDVEPVRVGPADELSHAAEFPRARQGEFLILESLELPEVRLTVRDGEIVGREGDVDPSAVPKSDQIQRKHARFFMKNSNWHVEHLPGSTGTTFTTVDGRRCTERMDAPLQHGSIVSLTYAPFRVRMD